MKRLLFTFVMMIVLVIVAGNAMGQTSTTPYPGGTYTYTMSGIDVVARTRTARVFIDNDGIGITPNFAVTGKYTVGHASYTVTANTNYYDIALPINTGSLTFSIQYGTIAAGNYQLYVVLYDGAATECANFIYTGITVTANNFDLVVTPVSSSICQNTNPSPDEDVAASFGQNTTFGYKVAKTGGDANDNWSFTLTIPTNGLELDIDNISAEAVAISAGLGTTNTVSISKASAGIYNVSVGNSDAIDAEEVTITLTVPTTPGVENAAFVGTVSLAKLYTNQTTNVYLDTEAGVGVNTGTVTIKNLPSIGTFTGN